MFKANEKSIWNLANVRAASQLIQTNLRHFLGPSDQQQKVKINNIKVLLSKLALFFHGVHP